MTFKRKRYSRDIHKTWMSRVNRSGKKMWYGASMIQERPKVRILTLKTRPRPAPLKVHGGQHDEGTLKAGRDKRKWGLNNPMRAGLRT